MEVFRDEDTNAAADSFSSANSTEMQDGFTVTHIPHRRRPVWVLPTILLVASLISMAWAGIVAWVPLPILLQASEEGSLFLVRQHVLANWVSGLQFAFSLVAILGAHELGHYFMSRYYRVPTTLPLFIPFPISPVGTCGAVIMMDGGKADRKEIFDIGIAGPLTGLVFAIPIAIVGLLSQATPQTDLQMLAFGQPLIVQFLSLLLGGSFEWPAPLIDNATINPMLMAAWVGFLITGLNMIPVSQLDGGHVIFGLLGQRSKYVAYVAYFVCASYVIYNAIAYKQPDFIIMLMLIPLIGISHPPSRNDYAELGFARTILGWTSLLIPLLCIPFRPIVLL